MNGLSDTFSNVEPGRMLAYKGSSGYIEIAVNMGKASDLIGKGSKVRIIFDD
ncbi:MAG: SAM hydroxide adenosyltransferase [Candidatus Kapabacteria bacterium]|nr:SAM hydroxide adenosyltransferase [Candidatus Kapabacteria bacterium]